MVPKSNLCIVGLKEFDKDAFVNLNGRMRAENLSVNRVPFLKVANLTHFKVTFKESEMKYANSATVF